MSQIDCLCQHEDTLTLPVTGLSLNVAASALECLSVEDVRRIVREELAGMPTGGGTSYSFDEQWTGGYWVDGRKIYQKTFNTGKLAKTTTTIPHGISGFDVLVQANGTLVNSGGGWTLLPVSSATSTVVADIIVSEETLMVRVSRTPSFPDSWVTIFYTCTDR